MGSGPNRDGTYDVLVRFTGFGQNGRTAADDYYLLTTQWSQLQRRMMSGSRMRLSWRLVDQKKTRKYLKLRGGLPSIRSAYRGKKRLLELLIRGATTAAIIDENGWLIESMSAHLRFDPEWVRWKKVDDA